MNDSNIVITGFGVASPIGLYTEAAVCAVRAGIAGFADHPFLVDERGDPVVVAMTPGLDTFDCAERCALLATTAIEQLMSTVPDRDVHLFLALPTPRPGLPSDLRKRLLDAVSRAAQGCGVSAASAGHEGGLMAVAAAVKSIVRGEIRIAIAGAVDSYIEARTIEWLEEAGRLKPSRNPWGFIPGESASFCIVTTAAEARRRDLRILSQVMGLGYGMEPHPILSDGVSRAEGLCRAMTQALAHASEPVAESICDMNGEPYRGDEYGFAMVRLRERFADSHDFMTPADCFGDVGAASGPLFASIATDKFTNGYARGAATLIWTSADRGGRAAMLLSAP